MVYRVLTMGYTASVAILKSETFDHCLSDLRDRQVRARVQARITRVAFGNPGDVEPIGSGISELRIHYGPGYRIYFLNYDSQAILLCGGTKATQQADIKRAHRLAKDWKEQLT